MSPLFVYKTKFPVSMSTAKLVSATDGRWVHHKMLPSPSITARFPSGRMVRRPDLSWRGAIRLATQTTVWTGILWYHIPRYRLEEPVGEKNPSSNSSLGERSVLPSDRDCVGSRDSCSADAAGRRRESRRGRMEDMEKYWRKCVVGCLYNIKTFFPENRCTFPRIEQC